jgi:hypothetical protein
MEPVQFEGYGERFKDTLDEYLVNSICGHYGVMPSEIGFNPKGGLGGGGFQLGQAESSEVIGAIPLANWVGRMLSHLSYTYLGMPRELEFKFMESGRQDLESIARTRDIEIKSGSLTLNESRSRAGMPLIESPEADMPIIVAGTGAYFVTENGIVPFDSAVGDIEAPAEDPIAIESGGDVGGGSEKPTPNVEDKPTEPEAREQVEDSEYDEGLKAADELKMFLRWLKKSPTRPFNFREVPVVYAEVLNKFIDIKDYDSARWYAERYLA